MPGAPERAGSARRPALSLIGTKRALDGARRALGTGKREVSSQRRIGRIAVRDWRVRLLGKAKK